MSSESDIDLNSCKEDEKYGESTIVGDENLNDESIISENSETSTDSDSSSENKNQITEKLEIITKFDLIIDDLEKKEEESLKTCKKAWEKYIKYIKRNWIKKIDNQLNYRFEPVISIQLNFRILSCCNSKKTS